MTEDTSIVAAEARLKKLGNSTPTLAAVLREQSRYAMKLTREKKRAIVVDASESMDRMAASYEQIKHAKGLQFNRVKKIES